MQNLPSELLQQIFNLCEPQSQYNLIQLNKGIHNILIEQAYYEFHLPKQGCDLKSIFTKYGKYIRRIIVKEPYNKIDKIGILKVLKEYNPTDKIKVIGNLSMFDNFEVGVDECECNKEGCLSKFYSIPISTSIEDYENNILNFINMGNWDLSEFEIDFDDLNLASILMPFFKSRGRQFVNNFKKLALNHYFLELPDDMFTILSNNLINLRLEVDMFAVNNNNLIRKLTKFVNLSTLKLVLCHYFNFQTLFDHEFPNLKYMELRCVALIDSDLLLKEPLVLDGEKFKALKSIILDLKVNDVQFINQFDSLVRLDYSNFKSEDIIQDLKGLAKLKLLYLKHMVLNHTNQKLISKELGLTQLTKIELYKSIITTELLKHLSHVNNLATLSFNRINYSDVLKEEYIPNLSIKNIIIHSCFDMEFFTWLIRHCPKLQIVVCKDPEAMKLKRIFGPLTIINDY